MTSSAPPAPQTTEYLAASSALLSQLPFTVPTDRWGFWGQRALQLGAVLAPIGMLISVPLIYGCLGLMVLGAAACRFRIWKMPGFYWWLALALWMTAMAILHKGQGAKVSGIVYSWPMVYLMAFAISLPWARRWVVWSLLVALAATGILSLLHLSVGLGHQPPFRVDPDGITWTRSVGFNGHHIRFGAVMALLSLLLSIRLAPQLPRALQYGAWVLAILLCLISTARGQALALFAGLWVRYAGRSLRSLIVVSLVIGVLAAAALIFLYFTQRYRVEAMFAFEDVRFQLWAMCWELWQANPVFGTGLRFNDALHQHFSQERLVSVLGEGFLRPGHAHNSFIGIALNFGTPALLLFCAWLAITLRGVWVSCYQAPQIRAAALAIMAVFVVGSLTEDLTGIAYARFAFVICLGWLWGLSVTRNAQGDLLAAPDPQPPEDLERAESPSSPG